MAFGAPLFVPSLPALCACRLANACPDIELPLPSCPHRAPCQVMLACAHRLCCRCCMVLQDRLPPNMPQARAAGRAVRRRLPVCLPRPAALARLCSNTGFLCGCQWDAHLAASCCPAHACASPLLCLCHPPAATPAPLPMPATQPSRKIECPVCRTRVPVSELVYVDARLASPSKPSRAQVGAEQRVELCVSGRRAGDLTLAAPSQPLILPIQYSIVVPAIARTGCRRPPPPPPPPPPRLPG